MPSPANTVVGIVTSAGKMQRAVRIRVARQVYNSYLQKHFRGYRNYLVSDPNDSLRLGDVVAVERPGRTISRRVKFIIAKIIAPYGPPIEERPRVLGREEIEQMWKEKTEAKQQRRAERRALVEGRSQELLQNAEVQEASREAREIT